PPAQTRPALLLVETMTLPAENLYHTQQASSLLKTGDSLVFTPDVSTCRALTPGKADVILRLLYVTLAKPCIRSLWLANFHIQLLELDVSSITVMVVVPPCWIGATSA